MSTARTLSGQRRVLLIATTLISLLMWAVAFPQVQANAQQSGPTLVEAKVVVDTPIQRRVRLMFSDAVCNVINQAGFMVNGGGPAGTSIGAVIVGGGCGTTVDVTFPLPPAPALGARTSVTVILGTVTDSSGQGNTDQVIALTVGVPIMPPLVVPVRVPGAPDPTAGPDFMAVAATEELRQVQYMFDMPLDEETAPVASDFGYRSLAGEDVDSASVEVHGATVLAQFNDPIDAGLRFYVRAEAVQDLVGRTNPPNAVFSTGITAAMAAAATAAAPELAPVAGPAPPGTTLYTFTFTQPVSLIALDRFALYDAAGTRHDAEGWTHVAPHMLRVGVPSAPVGPGLIGTVDAEAVEGTIGAVASNGVGCVTVVPPPGPSAAC